MLIFIIINIVYKHQQQRLLSQSLCNRRFTVKQPLGHFYPNFTWKFAIEDGTPLTRKALTKALRDALIAARVPKAELYKGHSFRRGGATSLARVGVPDSVIKTIGRWKSQAYQLYVDIDLNIMCSAAVQVGKLKATFGGNDVSSSMRRWDIGVGMTVGHIMSDPRTTQIEHMFSSLASAQSHIYHICLAWSFACCALNFAGRH